ncbi:MAG: hypothetical protein ABI999_02445 [Acidobacteriota bacterium]
MGLVFVGVSVFATLLLVALNSEVSRSFPYFFLLPWILLLSVVLLIPSVYLYKKGRFSLCDPIMFAGWLYFFPAFVIGGIALSVGWSQPYFLDYIQDAEINLPWTMVLIILGYAGLCIGYFLPVGEVAGRLIGDYFKISKEPPVSTFSVPGVVLVLLGMLNSALALGLGVIGYQGSKDITSYDGLLFLSTLFWLEGTFILWYVVFRRAKVSVSTYAIIALLVSTSLFKALFAGNRGSLLQSFIVVVLAFVLSGRLMRKKHVVIGAALFGLVLLIGMIYGTTFRSVRGNGNIGGIGDYTDNVIETITRVSNSSSMEAVEFGLANFAERIDVVSSLAVVVSNYEELAPYEASYGLNDNIQKDFVTTFVPRVLWNDKPLASDARRYGELYFDYGENSFAMTSIGDLLRNFGVPGVFLGMLLLGILLRTTYRALIENREPSVARATLYYMLLVSVSYEGFYGLIFPFTLKIGITSVIGIFIAVFLANRIDRSPVRALREG